jgi:hypothetical protein
LDGVKYAGRVEMSNPSSTTFFEKIAKGIRSTAKKVCGMRGNNNSKFNEKDRVDLVELVKSLQTPFINHDKSDRNVYKLDMSIFLGLSIDQQKELIGQYLYKADEHPLEVVNDNKREALYGKDVPFLASEHFGIEASPIGYNENLPTWKIYREYLLKYLTFIDTISCKKYGELEVSNQPLRSLPWAPPPPPGSSKAAVTPRGKRPAPAQASASVSSGGRRTKRTKHHRRTKRTKRSNHTKRRKH